MMKSIKEQWHKPALFLILVATAFLSFFSIWKEGYANTYYSAAVKSMLTSWHNFFFVSFDAGGYVSVDKPALGLWIQALSAYIFGFHGWSVILPQALAAVVSVALLYHLVQRVFGRPAGLISALVLAVTPILPAVSRTNNLDSTLVMLLMFAAWALVAAAEKGSLKLLLLSMFLVGLGFNVKMLQAFMVLPAFYLVYFMSDSLKTGRKLAHLAAASVLLLAVSLSWSVIVDLTPSDKRPYVGSSRTNSVLELALGYNGIQRILPFVGPMGGRGQDFSKDMENNSGMDTRADKMDESGNPQSNNLPDGMNAPPRNMMMGGFGGPGGEGGSPGLFRLFNQQMAGQISWLFPVALIGMLAAILRSGSKTLTGKKMYRQALLLWGVWILPMLVYFSIAGFFHRYYLIMLAPGLAALTGIGLTQMWKAYLDKDWKSYILPGALIANALLQAFMLSRYPEWSSWLTPIVFGLSGISALALLVLKFMKKDVDGTFTRIATAVSFAALLIAPSIWASTPIIYRSESTLPYAGPELSGKIGTQASVQAFGGGMGFSMDRNMSMPRLTEFLLKNKQDEKFLVAAPNAITAAQMILETGQPVMAVGGFLGTDNILSVDRLENLVKNGEIRYFLTMDMPDFSKMGDLPGMNGFPGGAPGKNSPFGAMPGGTGMMGMQTEITNWVKTHGKEVPDSQWKEDLAAGGSKGTQEDFAQFGRMMGSSMKLYDLK